MPGARQEGMVLSQVCVYVLWYSLVGACVVCSGPSRETRAVRSSAEGCKRARSRVVVGTAPEDVQVPRKVAKNRYSEDCRAP